MSVARFELVSIVHEESKVGDPVTRRRRGECPKVGAHAHCTECGISTGRSPPDDDTFGINEIVGCMRDDFGGLNAVLNVDNAPLAREALDVFSCKMLSVKCAVRGKELRPYPEDPPKLTLSLFEMRRVNNCNIMAHHAHPRDV